MGFPFSAEQGGRDALEGDGEESGIRIAESGDYIPLRKHPTCQTDIPSDDPYDSNRCFSVPRWQRLTLPDPSQRWDFESHTEPVWDFF
jgi:hypothetical protein